MYSQCQHEANANVQPMPAQSVYTPKSCLPVAEHSAASALALPQFYCTQLSANCCCNRRINAAGYEQADRGAGGYMASFSSICLISDSPNSSTWNSCSMGCAWAAAAYRYRPVGFGLEHRLRLFPRVDYDILWLRNPAFSRGICEALHRCFSWSGGRRRKHSLQQACQRLYLCCRSSGTSPGVRPFALACSINSSCSTTLLGNRQSAAAYL